MSRSTLAERAEVSVRWVEAVEEGDIRAPDVGRAMRCAFALGVGVTSLCADARLPLRRGCD